MGRPCGPANGGYVDTVDDVTAAPVTTSSPLDLDEASVYAEQVIEEVASHLTYPRRELLLATTRLAQWSQRRRIELSHSTVFTEATISAFVQDGLQAQTQASRGNVRAQLRRVREVLHGESKPTLRLAGAQPLAPYTTDEEAGFSDWAGRQKTPEFKRDARTILALGFGAGLSAGEIGEVRGADVLDDNLGIQILVLGDRSRSVQTVRSYESRLRAAAHAVKPEEYLIRPQRTSTPKNLLSNIVDRGVSSELGPQSQRMRASWLVHHLNVGTPVGALMEAAGLESLKALSRYLEFVTSPSTEVRRRALRR